MTSPDTSAAEVVALLRAGVGSLQTWPYDAVPTETTISSLCKLLTIGADTLDTSRAETAAVNARSEAMERDLRDALAVAEPWHNAYETQLARADALADLLDSNVASLGKQLADEWRAREAAEAKLAKAVDALKMPDAKRRQWFLSDLLEAKGYFNRRDLVEAFDISIPQASADIGKWQDEHADAAWYNKSTKRYEARVLAGIEGKSK